MTNQSRSSKSRTQKAQSASSKQIVSFPYIALGSGGPLKPALPLVIHMAKGRLTARALVDSGADHSILPMAYAAALGVDMSQAREVPCFTASGPGVYLRHDIPLEAEVEALNCRFAMTAAFAAQAPTILLGRDDFFASFAVCFDQKNATFSLAPVASAPTI